MRRLRISCGHAGHAVALADHDRQLRHGGLQTDPDGSHAGTERAFAFGLLADHESGHVDQVDDGNVEVVAEFEEVRLLVRAVAVERAAVLERVVGDDADGQAVDPGEHGDHRASPVRLDLEVVAAVDDRADQLVHRVGPTGVARDEVDELLACSFRRIERRRGGRQFVDVVGQVGEHRADLIEGVEFVFRLVVDAT